MNPGTSGREGEKGPLEGLDDPPLVLVLPRVAHGERRPVGQEAEQRHLLARELAGFQRADLERAAGALADEEGRGSDRLQAGVAQQRVKHVGIVEGRDAHRLVGAREPAGVLRHRDAVSALDAPARQERRARRGRALRLGVGVEHDDPGGVGVERLRHPRQECGRQLVEAQVGERHVRDALELPECRSDRLRLAARALLELPAIALALGGAPFGQVGHLDDHVQRLAVLVRNRGAAHERGDLLALGAQEPQLGAEAGQLAGLDPAEVVVQDGAVVRMDEAGGVAGEQVGVRAVQQREQGPVRVDEAAVERRQRDADRGVLERGAEAPLALAQRTLLLV